MNYADSEIRVFLARSFAQAIFLGGVHSSFGGRLGRVSNGGGVVYGCLRREHLIMARTRMAEMVRWMSGGVEEKGLDFVSTRREGGEGMAEDGLGEWLALG